MASWSATISTLPSKARSAGTSEAADGPDRDCTGERPHGKALRHQPEEHDRADDGLDGRFSDGPTGQAVRGPVPQLGAELRPRTGAGQLLQAPGVGRRVG